MTLYEYISEVGDDSAAALFGVSPRTAMSWRLGERVPRPRKAHEIVELTEGQVTLEGVYQHPKLSRNCA